LKPLIRNVAGRHLFEAGQVPFVMRDTWTDEPDSEEREDVGNRAPSIAGD
jgi:hypothetical protein